MKDWCFSSRSINLFYCNKIYSKAKITKVVKGLISETETGTIKTLEHGATQTLKSIKDILKKAGNKSIEELNKIVTIVNDK